MNIRYLQKILSRIDEIKIIGKNAIIDGIVCNVAGIVRYGLQLRLILLEYDEHYRQQIEEREISELCDVTHESETNRIMMVSREKVTQPLKPIKSVFIGDIEFEVSGSENHLLSVQDGESVLFLSELLRNGWNPEGIDYQDIDMLFLTSLDLVGDFTKIPDFENNLLLNFTMRKDSTSYLVEKPITLTINGEYPEKLWFKNKETGEENWAQINRVYLMDMWVDIEKTFSNPKLLKQMTIEQIATAKKDFEEKFLEICPKGMCYPIVEYECEECISLQFYTKNYLESKPAHKNSGMGFIVGTEKATGILGMKLKAAIIQEPVIADTVSIETELFQYYKTITPNDIIL
ncbi:hypothetical protein J2Z76_000140 [Sedimentibacter acidaminivorans]|uniref:Uncharacterized protein n=1 Tax=Sedimentibacter acidaminivorans TaxID=913099 RepID=A0ABS4G9C6_9FIRM|nr:hypothetical protein [Sedimentibacter acidaminivorans]MBP1924287.1 hypothetical protein [Sedimentibacter acidaminivorans]